MASRIVGIDLGAYSVKLALATPGFRGAVLHDLIERRVPPGDEPHEARAARVVGELVRDLGLEHDAAYAALSGDQVFFHVLEFDFKHLRRADLDKAVGGELEGILPIDLEDMVYAFEPIAREPDAPATGDAEVTAAFVAPAVGRVAPPTEGMRVLCAATQRDRVADLLARLGGVGAEPRALLAAPAIYPWVIERLALGGAPLAVVDVGHERTDVCVVTGGKTAYVRTIARGGRQLTDAIARTWRLDPAQAEAAKHQDGFVASRAEPASSDAWARVDQALRPELLAVARDLRQTLAGCRAKTGVTAARVLLVGGGARLRGLGSFLAEELRLPVHGLGEAERLALLGPKLAGEGHAADVACLAAGVAFEGGGGRPTFDLRQGELAFKADLSFLRAKVVQLVAAGLVVVAFAAASAYASLYRLRRSEEVLGARLAGESQRAFGQALTAPEVLARIAPTADGKAAGVLPTMTAYDVLLAFSAALPPRAEVTVDVDDIDVKPGKVTVRGVSTKTGTVETQDVIKAVTTSLKKHRCFADLTDESGQPGADGTRSFTLSIKTECI